MNKKTRKTMTVPKLIFRGLAGVFLMIAGGFTSHAEAGVALGATRVIYPAGHKQVQLAVTNNKDDSTFLIQSWVENAKGQKDGRFVVTPPLFSMKGKKENTLRIIDATNNQLPTDRESLFWMNVKAIPSMDKSKLSDNTLQLAIISRIKMLYRPEHLSLPPELAPSKLTFHREGKSLTVTNPTPFYLTITELKAGTRKLDNAFVPPMGTTSVTLPEDAGNNISFQTINDYGALTPKMQGSLQ